MSNDNLPPGVRDSDIPGNSKRDVFIENYLDKNADELLSTYIADIDRQDAIDKAIVDSPAYDEFLMQTPFDITGTVELFKQMYKKDTESIIELSDAFQTYADSKADSAWRDLCEYKRDARREKEY